MLVHQRVWHHYRESWAPSLAQRKWILVGTVQKECAFYVILFSSAGIPTFNIPNWHAGLEFFLFSLKNLELIRNHVQNHQDNPLLLTSMFLYVLPNSLSFLNFHIVRPWNSAKSHGKSPKKRHLPSIRSPPGRLGRPEGRSRPHSRGM